MPKSIKSTETDVCADCAQPEPAWASINHGVLVCDECAIVHRSLGRFISYLKPLRASNWRASQLQMVYDLYHSGSNSIWEHTLLDPHTFSAAGGCSIKAFNSSSSSANSASAGVHTARKKPCPQDPLTPTKSDFIRAKYQSLSFVNKTHSIKEGEDVQSESNISKQLHSSVRTPNLKTSLRLLAAGANPNYIHLDKLNSPLHMAGKSGQMSQVELLLIYGANTSIVDGQGKSAIDYAREAGHHEIVYRLVESQFDLPDRLTGFICQGRQPNHRNGEHFLIIDIKPEFLNFFPFPLETEKQVGTKNPALSVYRSQLYQNIQSLSNESFHELTRDVYDEIDRREVNAWVGKQYGNDCGKLSSNHQQLIVPFLPVFQFFTSTRNQARQKLALLNVKEFTLLIIDILNEIRHRIYGIGSSQDIKNSIYSNCSTRFNDDFDEDSEPLYDSVPSEGDDYDECNEMLSPEMEKPLLAKKPAAMVKSNASTTTKVKSDEYCTMKEQITNLIKQEFMNENKLMREEISRLNLMVQKLVEENGQLKHMVLAQNMAQTVPQPAPPAMPILQGDLKSHSVMFIDSGGDMFQRNSFLRNSNRIRPQSCNNNSGNNIIFNDNNISLQSMSSGSAGNNATVYMNNFYSGASQKSPGIMSTSNLIAAGGGGGGSPMHSSQQLHSSPGGQISPSLQYSTFSSPSISAVQQSSNSLTRASLGLPSKEDVIRKIEFITDGIKELLGNAREGRHEKFQLCSQRICVSVSDMINLFPESLGASKNGNLHQLHQALSSLKANTVRLNDECVSMHHEFSGGGGFHANKSSGGQDYRYIYGNVIDKAAEVASSVKNIVTFYNC